MQTCSKCGVALEGALAKGPMTRRGLAVLTSAALLLGGSAVRASSAAGQEGFAQVPTSEEQQRAAEVQRVRETEVYAERVGISVDEADRRLKWMKRATTDLVDRAETDLQGSFGGVWIEPKSGRVKLGVAQATTAMRSEAQETLAEAQLEDGADIVEVRYGMDELAAASTWLRQRLDSVDRTAKLPIVLGTTTQDNVVQIEVPPSGDVTDDQRAVVSEATQRFGSAVRVAPYRGEPKPRACSGVFCTAPLRGGVRILDPSFACTHGFLSIGRGGNSSQFAMTAGHCRNGASTWSSRFAPSGPARAIGPFQNSTVSASGDAGILQFSNFSLIEWWPQPYVYVTDSGDTARNEAYMIYDRSTSVVGQPICTTGASLGYSDCGTVTQVNTSYIGVGNLTRANFCGVGGDSGAPMYKYDGAFGVHVSGASFCDSFYTERAAAENITNSTIATWAR